MSRTREIETALRSLDPADPADPPAVGRAGAVLERILHSDPVAVPSHRAGTPEHRARRTLLAGAVVATVSAGLVVLPSLSSGDQAFASWTAAPGALSATERPAVAEACRDQAGPAGYEDKLRSAESVIAEQRGAWTTVVLAGDDGFTALCITDESSPFWDRGMIGSIGTPTGFVAPGPRDLVATDLGTGTANGAELSLAAGHAGSGVARVVYRSDVHGEVTATVSGGHFALWLPGGELEGASRSGVELDVTYRDGSTGMTRLTL